MKFDTSITACRTLLTPYHAELRAIVLNSWRTLMSIPDLQRMPLERIKRARAAVQHAYEMDEIDKVFADDPDVKVHEAFESKVVELRGQIAVRFKKVNADGRSSNIPTKRSMDFNDGTQYEFFDEMWSAPIRVDCGYELDPLEQSIAAVWIVRRAGERVDWRYEIPDPAATAVIPFTEPAQTKGGGARVIARPAKVEVEKSDQEEAK